MLTHHPLLLPLLLPCAGPILDPSTCVGAPQAEPRQQVCGCDVEHAAGGLPALHGYRPADSAYVCGEQLV